MRGNETAPGGMVMSSYIYGWDLNNGRGFENYKHAKETWDADWIPYESLWKIDGKIYKVIRILGKPVFDIYEKGG